MPATTVKRAPAESTSTEAQRHSDRPLTTEEKRLLAVLGLPTFGLSLAITIVATYVSKVASGFTTSTIAIGAIVGGEGIVALFIPLIAGTWSDRLRTRFGGRLPFLLAAVPPAAAALVLIGFVSSLLALALTVFAFFVFYFIAYEPYRALYPDLVDDAVEGRAQSTQALWRGGGTGLALLGGGLMLTLGRAVPFVVAAFILVAATAAFTFALLRRQTFGEREAPPGGGLRKSVRHLRGLIVEHPALRAFLIANALWELTLGALKSFIILYLTIGLGEKLSTSSLAVGAVAVMILAGAAVSGKLGDRFGRARTMRVAIAVYGLGFVVPVFFHSVAAVAAAAPFIAVGGGVLMTLPYALLAPMMPDAEHGALTGFYSLSRGLGTMLGPILAGVAIELLKGPFASTHGYAAMWIVCAVSALLSLPFLRRLRQSEDDRRALQAA